MKRDKFVIAVPLLIFLCIDLVKGHGMILKPAGRGSRWRIDKTAEANYDDMSNNCGGFHTMFSVHNGKCGLCGDSYGAAKPRDHELGGKFGGTGVIVKTYPAGSRQEFSFNITASHMGYVYYQICNLDKFRKESEECFEKYRLNQTDGTNKHLIDRIGQYRSAVVLPKGLRCNHCILRWTYFAGNNVNPCGDGTESTDCGNQETFKNCADIRIS